MTRIVDRIAARWAERRNRYVVQFFNDESGGWQDIPGMVFPTFAKASTVANSYAMAGMTPATRVLWRREGRGERVVLMYTAPLPSRPSRVTDG